MRKKLGILRFFVPLLVSLVAVAVYVLDSFDLRSVSERASSDVYQLATERWFAPVADSRPPQTVYVEIQSTSDHNSQAWPVSRKALAALLDELNAAGAAVVVLDNVFDEVDPLSPSNQLDEAWEEFSDLSQIEAMASEPDHDALLAAAIRAGEVVTGFHAIGARSEYENAQPMKKTRVIGGTDQNIIDFANYSRARTNLIQLSSASAGNGSDNIIVDGDGAVRRIPLAVAIDGEIYPSQILEALRLQSKSPNIALEQADTGWVSEKEQLTAVVIGERRIPVDPDGSLRLRFDGLPSVRKLSVEREGPYDLQSDILSGKIVFVGMERTRSNPDTRLNLSQSAPLTFVKALATEQIIQGTFSPRPGWARDAELMATIFSGLLALALGLLLASTVATPLIILGALATAGLGLLLYVQYGLFLNLAYAAGVLLIAGIVAVFARDRSNAIEFRADGRSIDFIPEAATSELAKGRVSAKAPVVSRRKKSERRATALVCNIRGLAELENAFDQDPAGLTDMVGDFLAQVTDLIKGANGTVIQYKNDQVVAAWNVHMEDSNHAISACECAFQLLSAVDRVNERLENHARSNGAVFDHLSLNVGINSGEFTQGVVAAFKKNDFSGAGEAFRTAFWLNRQAEQYGPAIIVGEETYLTAHSRYAMLEIDLVAMEDRPEPYRVFALVGNPVTKASPSFRALESAHHDFFDLYRTKRWTKAWSMIEEIREMNGAMPRLYDLYEERIEENMARPPGVDWQGEHHASG